MPSLRRISCWWTPAKPPLTVIVTSFWSGPVTGTGDGLVVAEAAVAVLTAASGGSADVPPPSKNGCSGT
ncbi:hypothetical protein [Streptomyces plumbiresistens]|uniref:Secreted protein n=1 Tax=Streptomyces plumbiresistens TaxID=511811 RepID=A0ABP7S3I8_9ACTN